MPSSPNMNLPLSVIGVTPASQWNIQLNQSLTLIDAHDHSPGRGNPITPDGLSISADLSFQFNKAVDLLATRWDPQDAVLSGPTDLTCAYVVEKDLYYNDADGNQVRITQNGGVAGSPGSIANLASPASASYDSGNGTFIWESDANTPATMDVGSIVIRQLLSGGSGITLETSLSGSPSYTLTLPNALPATSNGLLLTNNSGGQSFLDKGAANTVLHVDSGGANLEYSKLTQANMGSLGQQVSASSGAFSTSSSTYVDITNCSVTITTTGRPVLVMLQSADGSAGGRIGMDRGSSSASGDFAFVRDSTTIANTRLVVTAAGASSIESKVPASSFQFIDVVGAGTYTYKAQTRISNAALMYAEQVTLVAFEL